MPQGVSLQCLPTPAWAESQRGHLEPLFSGTGIEFVPSTQAAHFPVQNGGLGTDIFPATSWSSLDNNPPSTRIILQTLAHTRRCPRYAGKDHRQFDLLKRIGTRHRPSVHDSLAPKLLAALPISTPIPMKKFVKLMHPIRRPSARRIAKYVGWPCSNSAASALSIVAMKSSVE